MQTGLHRYKLYPGLLQNPRLNLDMPHAQQIERAADVVLFSNAAGLVALYLRSNSGRGLYPLAQTGKAAAQPVQRQFNTSSQAFLNASCGSVTCPLAAVGR